MACGVRRCASNHLRRGRIRDVFTRHKCDRAFVWCRPAAAVAPTSNSLTLFLTSPWSTHLVEPVWSGRGCGAMPFALLYGSLWVRTVQTQPSIMADRWRQVQRMAYIGSRGQVSPVFSSGNTQVCVGGAAKTWKHSWFGVCTW